MDPKYLFDDTLMRDFIVNGYCVVRTDFPASLHETIYQKTQDVFSREGNPGNNLLPRIPEVQKIYDHPAVVGALTSILGPSYTMHSHRHPHFNPPESRGGGWHKDSYWGYRKVRDHHPRWIMGMYYPQNVTMENGPTGVVPGSQYFESQVARLKYSPEKDVDPEGVGLPVTGEAGVVIFIHFDLWHRAFPNQSKNNRYMFKFQFTRMDEPSAPHWNRQRNDITLKGLSDHPRAPIWSAMWDWLCGQNLKTEDAPVDRLAPALFDESEEVRLNASYRLARLGKKGVEPLMEGLRHEKNEVKRDACYGLGALGAPAIASLRAALDDENENTRAYAVYALGDMGAKAGDVVSRLTSLVDDPSEFVRRNVAEALGQIRRKSRETIPALIRLMSDADAQTRFNTAYGLAKFGEKAQAAIPVLADAFYDENRYVPGHAAIALERIGTPEAMQALLHQLQATRWCPMTTRESTF